MRHQGDHVRLDVEQVGVDLQEGAQVLGGLEKCGPQVDVEMVGHEFKQLVDVERAFLVNSFSEICEELVGHHRIYLELLALLEGCGDLALVLFQEDNLLLHHEVLRVSGQEIFELLHMLTRDVADFWGSLRPVTQQALDRNLSPSSVLSELLIISEVVRSDRRQQSKALPQLVLEVFHRLHCVVPVGRTTVAIRALNLNRKNS